MHQTYGQLSGSVFFATGQTGLYRNIGVVGALLGLPFMYVLIASPQAGGLGLGAVGLALKMVVLQFVMVNVQLWFNVRLLSLGFWKFLLHQVSVPAALAVCAFASTAIIDTISLPRVPGFFASGVLYTLLVVAAVFAFPRLYGLERADLTRHGPVGRLFRSNRT